VSVGRLMCKSDDFSGFLTFRISLKSSTIHLQQNAQEDRNNMTTAHSFEGEWGGGDVEIF